MNMTYKQLQTALKDLRDSGVDIGCKLNASKEVLQACYLGLVSQGLVKNSSSNEYECQVFLSEEKDFLLCLQATENLEYNKIRYEYALFDLDSPTINKVFEGDDYISSAFNKRYCINTVVHLLGFLCLKEGDTDLDYFENYTSEQLNWVRSDRCENLNIIAMELEEKSSLIQYIYDLSHSNEIEWEEWLEEDSGDCYYPIRFNTEVDSENLSQDDIEIMSGDPSYDSSHLGYWSYGHMSKDMSLDECIQLTNEMFRELVNQ